MQSKSFIDKNLQDDANASKRLGKGGSSLDLQHMSYLSSRSKQSVLFLTSQCHPFLSESGTVFPFLNVSYFWIQSVQFSGLNGKQFEFVSKALQNLPFLERATFDDAVNVTDQSVVDLCAGLRHPWTRGSGKTGSVLHSLSLTLKQTSNFDPITITTYAPLGDLLQDLPYLEDLKLSLPSLHLFASLFQGNSKPLVPFTELNFSGFGFNRENCLQLAGFMDRLSFVQKLILFENPLGNGFSWIAEKFQHLRCLKV